jgi:large subunit ribosomal protein L21e
LLLAEKPVINKRLPVGPRPGFTLENVKMETITAIPYDIVKEGLQ